MAAKAGLHLDDWQSWVLERSLGERQDGKWSAFEVGLIVPRQNGKGSILEARELAGLLLFNEQLIVHTAHELKTAKKHYWRMRHLIERGLGLKENRDVKFRQSNEEFSIEVLATGNKLEFLARTTGSGRGYTGDVIILDEAFALAEDMMAALLPTMSAKTMTGNPQLWYTSSAGPPGSDILAKVRDRGIIGEPRLSYFDWSAEPNADLDDPETWATANPAFNIRISEDFIPVERGSMGDAEFARERCGIWHDPRTGRVIDSDSWSVLADHAAASAGTEVALAVDVGPQQDAASISVAVDSTAGVPVVDVSENRHGSPNWVIERVVKATETLNVRAVVIDSIGPAAYLIDELERRGVSVTRTSARQMQQACAGFFDAAMDGRMRHLDQPSLNTALAAGRKRKAHGGEAWMWHRVSSDSDITPLVSATLALWGLMTSEVAKPKRKRTGRATFA